MSKKPLELPDFLPFRGEIGQGSFMLKLSLLLILNFEVIVYMPSVVSKKSENVDSLLRRFKRSCEKASVLQELKKRARHVKRTKVRAQKKAAAIKRRIKQEAKAAPIPSRGVRGKAKSKKRK